MKLMDLLKNLEVLESKGVITAEERQTAFTQMMKVALDVAVAMENK